MSDGSCQRLCRVIIRVAPGSPTGFRLPLVGAARGKTAMERWQSLVECVRLESGSPVKGIVGSNPTLSAKIDCVSR
jgi:hypothetical protein